MPRTDPVQGVTSLASNEAPDIAGGLASVVDQLVRLSVMKFNSAGDRDTRILTANRKEGDLCYLRDVNQYWCVKADGGPWVRLNEDTWKGNESPTLVGATPPAGTVRIVEYGSAVATVSNNAGGVSVGYKTPFPNGVVTAICHPGDYSGELDRVVTLVSNCTLGAWNGIAFNATGINGGRVPLGGGVRINYIAAGW